MRAGDLNRRLKLQRVLMTADTEGVSAEAWGDVATIWAHINPASGIEVSQAAQTEEKITHTVTCRWRPDMTPKQRFLYIHPPGAPARIFLIHTMLDADEGRREITAMCEEIVTSGVGAT